MTDRHSLKRTSPKGGDFIGFCTKCGTQGLTFEDAQHQECPNPGGLSQDDALMIAIRGDTE